jgi:EmrB/QacA subfamily drug resistance transporter
MPLYGKLGDVFGRRAMVFVSVFIFLTGSVLCGFAQSMLQLIVFRALQGAGAGGLLTLALTVIADVVEPRQRGRYQSLIVATVAVCQLAGPLMGGALTEYLSWRWIFHINLPIGAVALTLIWFGLTTPHQTRAHQVDYSGVIALSITSALVMLLLTWGGSTFAWNSPVVAVLAGAALLSAYVFLLVERGASEPILPLRLFSDRRFALGVSALTLMTFAMQSTMVFAPLYLQVVLGLSPSQSGMAMVAQVSGMLCASLVTRSAATSERPKHMVIAGVATEAASLLGLTVLAFLDAGVGVFAALLFVRGLGMGVGIPILTSMLQNNAEPADLGVATSSMMFVRSIGGVFGVSLGGLILNMLLSRAGVNVLHAAHIDIYRNAIGASFMLNTLCMLTAVLMIKALPTDLDRHRTD